MAVALVTGGAGGIGTGIVRSLVAAGHQVAIGYATAKEQAGDLARDLQGQGANAVAVHCEVTDVASIEACFSEIEGSLGPPLVVVNNAGVSLPGATSRLDHDRWDRSIAVNLTGTFWVTQRALPAMLEKRWGRIINTTTPVASTAWPGGVAYSASKAGVNMLTAVLALEVAKRGITVNAVSPGYVPSSTSDSFGPEVIRAILEMQAQSRPVRPDEVGALVTYLASDDAEMINGQVIRIDGGGPLIVNFKQSNTRQ